MPFRFFDSTLLFYGGCLIVVAVISGVLRLLIEGFRGREYADTGLLDAGPIDTPYVSAETLLSAAERSFFRVLQEALGADYHLFAKVRLADIVNVNQGLGGKHYYQAFNRISAKHVDFVVCEPDTFRIVGVIELDDSSHRTESCQERDVVKNRVLAAAGIPILRVTARRAYSSGDLRQQAIALFA